MGLNISGERLDSKTKTQKKSEESSNQTREPEKEHTVGKMIKIKVGHSPELNWLALHNECSYKKPGTKNESHTKAKFQNTKGRAVLDILKTKNQNPQNPNDIGEHTNSVGRQKQQNNIFKVPKKSIHHTRILYLAKLWIKYEARIKTFSSWQDLKKKKKNFL